MERQRLVSDMQLSRPAPDKKSGRLIVGVLVCSLLMGVSFCFLLNTPAGFFTLLMEVPADGRPLEEQCDLFTGEWIQDSSGPAYTSASCKFSLNCMENGRPDTLFLYWRWKPHGCDIPPFNAEKFMNAMRDKSWAAIGDSIFRNHMESVVCLVSKFSGKPMDNMMWDIEVEEFEKAAAIGSKNGIRMKLLDTFHLSLLRPDGHPGPYHRSHRFVEDVARRRRSEGHRSKP